MTEAALMREIMLAVGARPDFRVWRNNVGVALHPDGSRVRYGVANPGGADLIGIRRVVVAPEHIGRTLGQFVALEVKTGAGRLTLDQRRFLACVADFGGIGAAVRCADDAAAALQGGLFA